MNSIKYIKSRLGKIGDSDCLSAVDLIDLCIENGGIIGNTEKEFSMLRSIEDLVGESIKNTDKESEDYLILTAIKSEIIGRNLLSCLSLGWIIASDNASPELISIESILESGSTCSGSDR